MQIHVALVFAVWWVITFFFMVSLLLFLKNRRRLHDSKEEERDWPQVSVVVPAWNEQAGIAECVDSLLQIEYPKDKLEIIVVNDGSTDSTADILQPYADRGDIVFVNNKKNQGKSTALNIGMATAKTEFVATMDADTVCESAILKKTVPYFDKGEDVAAVMVRVQVKNPRNWLERIIAIEYNLGLGFYPKLISYLDSLYLTPGQFSIYRKEKILEIGGFDKRSIVEDTEIAYRIQKARYRIECCMSASAYTAVPDNLRAFYYQRKRWYTGTFQTIYQHKDVFFNRRLGNFGLYFLPVNFSGIFLGMILFLSTIYLIVYHAHWALENLLLIRFDVMPLIKNFWANYQFDPYSVSMFTLLATSPFLMNMVASYIGLKTLGLRVRENLWGYFCFLFFFIPYHILWLLSLYFAVLRKEVKWREST